jgi:dTDP-4-amino-4,6-dideoxygalactose transaminase
MTALTLDRHEGRAISYDVVQSGLNYRIDEIRSALGIVQLEKLHSANAQRGKLVERYVDRLKEHSSFVIPFQDLKDVESVYHIFPIFLNKNVDRIALIGKLKQNGIQSSIHYPAFKEFTAFKDIGLNDAPIAEEISKRELTLPLYPTMTIEQVDLVCNSLEEALGEE